MQFPFLSRSNVVIIAVFTAAGCLGLQGQDTQGRDAKAIPPRATPADYQAHAQAGKITVAAEFAGHSVPTPEAIFSTSEYVVVEVGLFGPPETPVRLSFQNFSLRINGKKSPVPAQPYALVFKSLKDPEWAPPESGTKPKASISAGGNQGDGGSTPAPVHVPIGVERAMERRVEKASLAEGERTLPEAGLIFFPYRGKTDGIHSMELLYEGPAGKASLALQP